MNAKGPEENFWDDGSVLCQERGRKEGFIEGLLQFLHMKPECK